MVILHVHKVDGGMKPFWIGKSSTCIIVYAGSQELVNHF